MTTITTNLIINPSVEVDLTGISGWLATETVTRDTTVAHTGSASAKIVVPGNDATEGALFISSTVPGSSEPPRTFAHSAWVLAPVGETITLYGFLWTTGFADLRLTNTTAVATGDWQRLETVVTSTAGDTLVREDVRVGISGVAGTFWVDAVQIEEGSVATAYFDGDSTDTANTTYAWTGTEHASASTRTVISNAALRRIRSQFQLRPY